MRTLTLSCSLSLTGDYARMGRQAHAALRLLAADQSQAGGVSINGARYSLALDPHDDRSDAQECAAIYRSLCSQAHPEVRLLLGPYSSRLTRVAASVAGQRGMLLINHGGAADDLHDQRNRLIVSVLSPASDYLAGLVRLIAGLKFWRKRVAVVSAPSPFARAVVGGFEAGCAARVAHRRGVRLRLKASHPTAADREGLLAQLARARANVLVAAGSFEQDVELVRAAIEADLNLPVIACVAAGVAAFSAALGALANGIIGPSQWEEQLAHRTEIGPSAADFARRFRIANPGLGCDYPAAQAYAAGLVAITALKECTSLDHQQLRAALSDLRTSTLFGDFAIDRVSGRQIGHKTLLVQWHEGRKVIIDPEVHAELGALEIPSGWRLILGSIYRARFRPPKGSETIHEEDEGG
jgi:ABC-type branched-subunit amino acid transport system substrate-binding protein